mgnify:CR=1 FL=1
MVRYRVTVVGATGLVGQELVKLLYQRQFPLAELRVLASRRSAGKALTLGQRQVYVGEARPTSFQEAHLVFFAANPETNAYFIPYAVRAGALVIEVSHRRDRPQTPLIVPEINGETLRDRVPVLACPGSVSTILALALYPLHLAATLKRVVVSTYQAVSDRGRAAMEELNDQSRRVLQGQGVIPHVLPHQIAFNALPETDVFLDNGTSREEWRIAQEVRQLLAAPDLGLSITTAWVPVLVGHALAVHAEFETAIDRPEALKFLAAMPGVRVLDDPNVSLYPHPWTAAGADDVLVGRVRQDPTVENGLALWVVGDNLRKGQALNAVQIAELAVRRGWLE